MTLKIESAKPTGTWDGPNGTLYQIQVQLSDGTSGEVNAKTPDRWKAGDEVVVTSKKDTQYGSKLKLDRADFANGASPARSSGQKSNEPRIESQWAINAAINLYAIHSKTAVSADKIKAKALELLQVRDEVAARDKSNPASAQTTPADDAPF